MSEIRAQRGIADAEISIRPAREADFRCQAKCAKPPFQSRSNHNTPGMPVSQLGDVHALDVYYAVERTTEVDEWLEVLTTD